MYHLAPFTTILVGTLVKKGLTHFSQSKCCMCGSKLNTVPMKTQCCHKPLCSELCTDKWREVSNGRCIWHR